MREHHPFRVGRSTRGVADGSQVVGVDGFAPFGYRVGIFQQEFFPQFHQLAQGHFPVVVRGLVVEHHHVPYIRQECGNGSDFLQLSARHKHDLRFGVYDSENEIVALFEFDRKRNIGSTRVQYSQLADDPCVAPFGEQSDFLPVFYAE